MGPVVILILLVGRSQKKITRRLYYVICKQRKDQILVLGRDCTITARTIDLFRLGEQYLAYQVRNILKTGKRSKVEIGLKRYKD